MNTEPIDFIANTLSGEDLYLRHADLIAEAELRDLTEEERAEFEILEEVDNECGLIELRDETLIAVHYFTTYARELAEELEMVGASDAWPYNCIDWEQAAHELSMDYTPVEVGGRTFYVR